MLKYYKEFFEFENAEVIQVVILVCFILFFVGLVYSIIEKPKGYYKETSELPLEEDSEEDKLKI